MMLIRARSTRVRVVVAVLTGVSFLALWTAPALATWTVRQDGNTWYVREGNTMIPMPDQQTAESVKDKFNKIEEKADKRAGKDDKKNGKDKGGSK